MNDSEPSPTLIIRYEGAVADNHRLDLHQLGESLVGIERIITVGLFVLEVGRMPVGRERLNFEIQALIPRRGSFEIQVLLSNVLAVLPLFQSILGSDAREVAKVIWRWISGVVSGMAGQGDNSSYHFTKMIEVWEGMDIRRHESLDRMDARRHLETLGWQKLANATKKAVAPIGNSCESMVLQNGIERAEVTDIDFPMATTIRSNAKLEVGDMEKMRIRVDGVTLYNRQLRVVHPDVPGKHLTAHVRDPAFDSTPNIYIDALGSRKVLEVDAKRSVDKRSGDLRQLYIMDARAIEE